MGSAAGCSTTTALSVMRAGRTWGEDSTNHKEIAGVELSRERGSANIGIG